MKQAEKENAIHFPQKKYSIIYADPPWGYQNRSTRAAANKHYDVMKLEDIKNMPVNTPRGGVSLMTIVLCLCGRLFR